MLLCPFYISIDKIIIIYVLEFLNGHIDITDYVQIMYRYTDYSRDLKLFAQWSNQDTSVKM